MSEKREFLIALSPVAQELVKQANTYELEINKVTIDNNEQRGNAVELGKKLNGLKKDLDNERLNQTRPIEAAADEIRDYYKPITGTCETMVKTLKDAILKFDQEERRKAEEAARIARLKAEEEARKERERLAKLAEKQMEQNRFEKAEETINRMEEVAPVVAPVIMPQIQKQKGESTRKIWKFRVIDEKLIPREYLTRDDKKIQGVVNSLKSDANIPGIEVYFEESLALGR
jgi:hypothetical protein